MIWPPQRCTVGSRIKHSRTSGVAAPQPAAQPISSLCHHIISSCPCPSKPITHQSSSVFRPFQASATASQRIQCSPSWTVYVAESWIWCSSSWINTRWENRSAIMEKRILLQRRKLKLRLGLNWFILRIICGRLAPRFTGIWNLASPMK